MEKVYHRKRDIYQCQEVTYFYKCGTCKLNFGDQFGPSVVYDLINPRLTVKDNIIEELTIKCDGLYSFSQDTKVTLSF